jgi:hypothetical protein
MSNSPGGIRTNRIPSELVISTWTPRHLAQAASCSLAFAASKGATAGCGASGESFQGGMGSEVVFGAAGLAVVESLPASGSRTVAPPVWLLRLTAAFGPLKLGDFLSFPVADDDPDSQQDQ